MSNVGDKISGKAKQAVGEVTDDKKLQAEGRAQELKGKAGEIVDDAKHKVEKTVDDAKKNTEK